MCRWPRSQQASRCRHLSPAILRSCDPFPGNRVPVLVLRSFLLCSLAPCIHRWSKSQVGQSLAGGIALGIACMGGRAGTHSGNESGRQSCSRAAVVGTGQSRGRWATGVSSISTSMHQVILAGWTPIPCLVARSLVRLLRHSLIRLGRTTVFFFHLLSHLTPSHRLSFSCPSSTSLHLASSHLRRNTRLPSYAGTSTLARLRHPQNLISPRPVLTWSSTPSPVPRFPVPGSASPTRAHSSPAELSQLSQ